MNVDTCDIKRLIKLAVMPQKQLPLASQYKDGQIDMADTITRLVEVMENGEGSKIAEALDKDDHITPDDDLNLDELLKIRDALNIINSFHFNWAKRHLEDCNASIQVLLNKQEQDAPSE